MPTPSYLVGASYLFDGTTDWEHRALRSKLLPPQTPQLGLYDTNDLSAVETHISWAAQHGIDFFVLPYLADQQGRPDRRLRLFPHASNIEEIEFCLSYKPAADPSLRTRDMAALSSGFFNHPRYLKHDGQPVLFLTDAGSLDEETLDALDRALASEGHEVFLVGCPSLTESVSQTTLRHFDALAPGLPTRERLSTLSGYGASRHLEQALAKARQGFLAGGAETVLPVVWPGLNERGQIPPRAISARSFPIIPRAWAQDDTSTSLFDRLLELALPQVDPKHPFILLDSWNDWPRDTAIEPLKTAPATRQDVSGKELYTGGHDYRGQGMAYLEVLRNRTVALDGVVVDEETGYPLSGVPVAAWNSAGSVLAVGISDARGRYRLSRLSLRAGECRLGVDRAHAVDVIVSASTAGRLKVPTSPQTPVRLSPSEASFQPYFPELWDGLAETLGSPASPALEVGTRKLHAGPEAGSAYQALKAGKDWQPALRDILKTRLSRGDIVVDARAGVGLHALEAAEMVGPGGRVICFESDRRQLRDLLANAKEANLSNLEAYNFAIAERTGWQESETGAEVEKRSLDSFSLPPVALLRLGQVKAAENPLRGARALLRDSQPVLILDVPDASERSKVLAALPEWGYRGAPIADTDSLLALPIGDGLDRALVDIGGKRTRELILEGVSVDEVDGFTTFAWSDQVESSIRIPLRRALPKPYVLGIRARALPELAPVKVRVMLNGADLGDLEVPADWSGAELEVPEGLLQEGYNTLLLRYGVVGRPRALSNDTQDDRPMAIALDKVWLCPQGSRLRAVTRESLSTVSQGVLLPSEGLTTSIASIMVGGASRVSR